VGCSQYREALSALLDREEPNLPLAAVHAHLASCSDCVRWEEEAGRAGRLVRVAPAEVMPDLAPLVLHAAPTGRRLRLAHGVRAALVVVAVVQALVAWSGALTGHDSMTSGHLAEETGAWNLALAVAFLAAATRPKAAGALVAPIGVFVVVLFVLASGDIVTRSVTDTRLASHLLVAVGLGLMIAAHRLAGPDLGRTPTRASGPREDVRTGPALLVPVGPAPTGPTASAGRSAA
jgi:predicted anti-sigma-YlaC factor YlaD